MLPSADRLNWITGQIIGGGLSTRVQTPLPLVYKTACLDCAYRIDLLVERFVVVEIKSVAQLAPIHTAQMLTYLKLSGCPVGLIMNFNVNVLHDGICRVVNDFPE